MFEKSAIFFQYVLSPRALEILMRIERSKYVEGVENIRPIGQLPSARYSMTSVGLELEKNKKKNIDFYF